LKVERGAAMFQWTADEQFCCRSLPDGKLQLLDGTDLGKPALTTLPWDKPVHAFELAPPCTLGDCLCVFTSDSRDSLQRVTAPAEAAIFRLTNEDAIVARTVPIQFGQQAELKWCPTGTAVLAHCQTDIDDSGQSYYGGSKLVLISRLGKYTLDLTEATDSVVQAVEWCPGRDEFVLIQGFQPAKATLWTWDPEALKCSVTAVLQESAHRNTIRWNKFGSIVCIAGFGNLAGQMTFFGRGEKGLKEISSCEASCAVSAEWAPDGRHLMTATLAPRMRVDNGFSIWSALHGTKVAESAFEALYEAQWQPDISDTSESARFIDISPAEIDELVLSGGVKSKQAYRPPTGRSSGSNRVAMMMRGELGGGRSGDGQRKDEHVALQKSLEAKEEKKSASRQPDRNHGDKKPCPTTGWEYLDPKGKKQGPFALEQMVKWYEMGVFKGDLRLRCDPDDRFIPLKELFPHPMVPFHRAPKRPTM
jgi:translation initiation factor 2A